MPSAFDRGMGNTVPHQIHSMTDSGLVGSTDFHSLHPQGHEPEHHWEGNRESRRCTRGTFPESYITKCTSMRRFITVEAIRSRAAIGARSRNRASGLTEGGYGSGRRGVWPLRAVCKKRIAISTFFGSQTPAPGVLKERAAENKARTWGTARPCSVQ